MTVPVDIYLTRDRTWKLAGDGDLAVATDQRGVIQDVVVRLLNETTPNLGGGITALFVEEFESDIESALDSSPYVEGPYEVNVVDADGDTVTVNVSTAEMTITEDFNLND